MLTQSQQIKRDTLAAVDDFDMNGEEEKISMALVAQYLIREGFTGTAAAFEKDIREEAAARDGTAPRPSRPKPMSPETRTRASTSDISHISLISKGFHKLTTISTSSSSQLYEI